MKKVLLLIFFFIISPVIAQTNLDWKYITPIKENSRIRDIEVTPNNTIYLLNDLGNDNILRSQDNGETWKIVFAPGNQLLNMQMIDDNLGYILSSFGVYKTTDGFQTVTYIDFSSSDYQRLFFYNSNLGFLCGGLGRIYKTTNGGQSFSNAHTGNTNITINDVYFISEDIGFACGTNGKIFKTTNQGASWTAIASPTTKILKRFLFIDDNTAYIVGYSGTILKTTDQGETWTAIQSNTVYNLENIAHINNNFIAVANYGRIVTSSDGTTWTEQQQIDSASLNDFYSISSFAGSYIIGGYGKMFKSQNLADWSVYIKGINRSNLVDISFSDNNNGVAVGDGDAYSVLLRTTDGGKTWINKSTTPGMQGSVWGCPHAA